MKAKAAAKAAEAERASGRHRAGPSREPSYAKRPAHVETGSERKRAAIAPLVVPSPGGVAALFHTPSPGAASSASAASTQPPARAAGLAAVSRSPNASLSLPKAVSKAPRMGVAAPGATRPIAGSAPPRRNSFLTPLQGRANNQTSGNAARQQQPHRFY